MQKEIQLTMFTRDKECEDKGRDNKAKKKLKPLKKDKYKLNKNQF